MLSGLSIFNPDNYILISLDFFHLTIVRWKRSNYCFSGITFLIYLVLVSMLKNFYGGNLNIPKFKKLKKVCSNVGTCTKNVKTILFLAKLYSKTVYCF